MQIIGTFLQTDNHATVVVPHHTIFYESHALTDAQRTTTGQ